MFFATLLWLVLSGTTPVLRAARFRQSGLTAIQRFPPLQLIGVRKNRLAPPPKITINGQDVFVSANRGPEELPAAVIEDLLLTDNASDGDEWKGALRPCDRIWQAYQERGGSEERWMFRNVITTLPNGITVHTRGERYLGCEPNPFRNVTEPHLRAALKAKGYL